MGLLNKDFRQYFYQFFGIFNDLQRYFLVQTEWSLKDGNNSAQLFPKTRTITKYSIQNPQLNRYYIVMCLDIRKMFLGDIVAAAMLEHACCIHGLSFS